MQIKNSEVLFPPREWQTKTNTNLLGYGKRFEGREGGCPRPRGWEGRMGPLPWEAGQQLCETQTPVTREAHVPPAETKPYENGCVSCAVAANGHSANIQQAKWVNKS